MVSKEQKGKHRREQFERQECRDGTAVPNVPDEHADVVQEDEDLIVERCPFLCAGLCAVAYCIRLGLRCGLHEL